MCNTSVPLTPLQTPLLHLELANGLEVTELLINIAKFNHLLNKILFNNKTKCSDCALVLPLSTSLSLSRSLRSAALMFQPEVSTTHTHIFTPATHQRAGAGSQRGNSSTRELCECGRAKRKSQRNKEFISRNSPNRNRNSSRTKQPSNRAVSVGTPKEKPTHLTSPQITQEPREVPR